MNKKKIAFNTLGCKLNFAETTTLAREISKHGFEEVSFKEKADIYVVNTCYVTQIAEKKSKAMIKQAHKLNPEATIAVIGCFTQLKPEEIEGMAGVDIIYGASNKFDLVDFLKKYNKSQEVFIDTKETKDYHASFSSGSRTRTFLKIQDGCDYFCAYCTIPYARGRSRSDSIENIVNIAKRIAKTKTKEVVITGVNIGDFGKGIDRNLLDLLKELDKIEGIDRYRLSSIEPDLLSFEIIDFIAQSKKFLPHFHIPLQSASNDVLKLMKRKHGREVFLSKLNKIKELMPHACVALDIIVGFPGETDESFMDTYEFLKKIDISYIHVFTFSEREGTLAARMDNKVEDKVKKERSKLLHELSENKKEVFYNSNKGLGANVLFESTNNNGFMSGFTENYIKVKRKFDEKFINEIVQVSLDNRDGDAYII